MPTAIETEIATKIAQRMGEIDAELGQLEQARAVLMAEASKLLKVSAVLASEEEVSPSGPALQPSAQPAQAVGVPPLAPEPPKDPPAPRDDEPRTAEQVASGTPGHQRKRRPRGAVQAEIKAYLSANGPCAANAIADHLISKDLIEARGGIYRHLKILEEARAVTVSGGDSSSPNIYGVSSLAVS